MCRGKRWRMRVDDFAIARGATAPVTSKQTAGRVSEPKFVAEIMAGRDPHVAATAQPVAEHLTVADFLDCYCKDYVEAEGLRSLSAGGNASAGTTRAAADCQSFVSRPVGKWCALPFDLAQDAGAREWLAMSEGAKRPSRMVRPAGLEPAASWFVARTRVICRRMLPLVRTRRNARLPQLNQHQTKLRRLPLHATTDLAMVLRKGKKRATARDRRIRLKLSFAGSRLAATDPTCAHPRAARPSSCSSRPTA